MNRIINPEREPGTVADGAVRIDRRTKWGNPFVIGRGQVIARFRADLCLGIACLVLRTATAQWTRHRARRNPPRATPRPGGNRMVGRYAPALVAIPENRNGNGFGGGVLAPRAFRRTARPVPSIEISHSRRWPIVSHVLTASTPAGSSTALRPLRGDCVARAENKGPTPGAASGAQGRSVPSNIHY